MTTPQKLSSSRVPAAIINRTDTSYTVVSSREELGRVGEKECDDEVQRDSEHSGCWPPTLFVVLLVTAVLSIAPLLIRVTRSPSCLTSEAPLVRRTTLTASRFTTASEMDSVFWRSCAQASNAVNRSLCSASDVPGSGASFSPPFTVTASAITQLHCCNGPLHFTNTSLPNQLGSWPETSAYSASSSWQDRASNSYPTLYTAHTSLEWAYLSPREARELLANRRLLFIGDSTTQELVAELIAFLEEMPADMDHLHADWVWQHACPGHSFAYQARTFATSRFPSPALSVYNISIHQLWNGHVDECNNLGPVSLHFHELFQKKLAYLASVCMNRTAHIRWMQEQFHLAPASAEVDLDPLTSFHAIRAQLNESTGLYGPMSESAGPTSQTTPWNSYTTPCPTAPSLDFIIFNTGQHLVYEKAVVADHWRPPSLLLDEIRNTTTHFLAQLHRLKTQAVVWKDATPTHQFPSLARINTMGRSFASVYGDGQQLNWPVEGLLSGLTKTDDRHCSYKDLNAGGNIPTRNRHVRTHWCHAAVQLLFSILHTPLTEG